MAAFTVNATLTFGSPSATLRTPSGWVGLAPPSIVYSNTNTPNQNPQIITISNGVQSQQHFVLRIASNGKLLLPNMNGEPLVRFAVVQGSTLAMFTSGAPIIATCSTFVIAGESIALGSWGIDAPPNAWELQ